MIIEVGITGFTTYEFALRDTLLLLLVRTDDARNHDVADDYDDDDAPDEVTKFSSIVVVRCLQWKIVSHCRSPAEEDGCWLDGWRLKQGRQGFSSPSPARGYSFLRFMAMNWQFVVHLFPAA